PAESATDVPTPPGWHVVMAVAAALAAGLLLGGGPVSTVVIAALTGAGAWRVLVRSAGAPAERAQESGIRELPHLVGLLAAGLRPGAAPPAELEAACRALPGPAADLVADV